MSLVYLDNESDPWIFEQESCERFYREIVEQLNSRNGVAKTTEMYASQSASIRFRLKQFSTEVEQLKNKLEHSFSLTYEEAERRHRLIENLQSKYVLLLQRFNDRDSRLEGDKRELFGAAGDRGASLWALEEDDATSPLLATSSANTLTVEQLRRDKQRMLEEQERGLENLSQVISRQKDIAVTIGNEVDLQNDLVDDIAERMDRTNSNIQRETVHVRVVSDRDTTCCYWVVILILFAAIITVLLV